MMQQRNKFLYPVSFISEKKFIQSNLALVELVYDTDGNEWAIYLGESDYEVFLRAPYGVLMPETLNVWYFSINNTGYLRFGVKDIVFIEYFKEQIQQQSTMNVWDYICSFFKFRFEHGYLNLNPLEREIMHN